jgi:H+-transporting ATPase
MRLVLGVATVLGVVGPIAAFGMFYLGDKVFHLDHAHLQTLMYLTLSVAGHLTIFLARTRGPFWSIRPARILLLAVLGTQALATLIAVYGIFMTPLGWGYAALVWGYALVWFLLTDRIKLVAYGILDPFRREAVALTGTTTSQPGLPTGTPKGVAHTSTVAPFHSDADSEHSVYHDTSECPYGREIKTNGNDKPGTDDRRLCDWCARQRTSAA